MKIDRKQFKSNVIGMLLGDAWLQMHGKHARLMIEHTSKQKAYIDWKASIMRQMTEVGELRREREIQGKKHIVYRVTSRTNPIYSSIYYRMYYKGRKTVDEFILKSLTPESLAIWYMDDGHLDKRDKIVKLFTANFNYAENELIAYWIAKKFGVHFNPRKRSNGKKYHWILVLPAKDREKFFKIVEPYIHESMKYKIVSHEVIDKKQNQ